MAPVAYFQIRLKSTEMSFQFEALTVGIRRRKVEGRDLASTGIPAVAL